jgi:cytochrome c-type biogenesis protein CcmF
MAIGPKLKWIKSNLQNRKQLFLFLIISFLLSLLIIKNTNVNFLLNTVLVTSAFYLFFITLRDFFNKNFVNLAQNTAHFGFSLLILSILFNNIFSKEIITNLRVGETYQSKNFKIYFEDIETKNQQNYKSIIGKFKIQSVDGNNEILKPELRIYNQPIIITSEADIKTNLLTDKFMTMNSIQNQDYFNVRYQVKPFMIWIWISVFLITLGGLTSLLKKKYED